MFPCELYKWLSKLADSEPTHKHGDPIVWTPKLVKRIERYDYKIAGMIDYWIDNILGDFITKFSIDTYVSYSEAERLFSKGPRGKYLKSLKTWMKCFCEKRGLFLNLNV